MSAPYTGAPPYPSLPAGSTLLNTAGNTLDNVQVKPQHSLFVVSAGTTVTGGVVTLQGSNDNVNWFNTTCTVTPAATNTAYAANLANFPFQFVRATITTAITGTGSPSVTAYVASA